MPRTIRTEKGLIPGSPVRPLYLSLAAASEWDRLTEELASSNMWLTVAHRTPLALAATTAADMADARAAIERDGAYITGRVGLVAHPATKRLDALRRDYIKVFTMLGLRVAVATEPEDDGASLADLLSRR